MARWKPEVGEEYYTVYISHVYVIDCYCWEDDEIDHDYYLNGNCFRTEEEAQRALEKVKELLLSLHGDNEQYSKFDDITLFNQITKSPEVLAEKLVYCEEPERFCENPSWCSVLLGKVSYAKKAEAIAAIKDKLNEVIEHE